MTTLHSSVLQPHRTASTAQFVLFSLNLGKAMESALLVEPPHNHSDQAEVKAAASGALGIIRGPALLGCAPPLVRTSSASAQLNRPLCEAPQSWLALLHLCP